MYMPYANTLQTMACWRMCVDQVGIVGPTKIDNLCACLLPTPFRALKPFKLLLAYMLCSDSPQAQARSRVATSHLVPQATIEQLPPQSLIGLVP